VVEEEFRSFNVLNGNISRLTEIQNMALSCVYLAADVYMVCLQHALSTEKEEVMGLLLGEVRIVKSTD
jgi:hypothetical protein